MRRPCAGPFTSRAQKFSGPVLAGLVMAIGAAAPGVTSLAAERDNLAGSGVQIVPRDAAFLSASLRLREQYDRIVGSNAFAALKKLPAVARALDSFEEQRTMPGSPFSMFETFMELPENEQAADLIRDMVATDTFVYGEPSCVSFLKLLQKLQQAQQAAGLIPAGDVILDLEDVFPAPDDDLPEDSAAVGRSVRPVAFRADAAEQVTPGQRQTRMVVEALAANLDLLVVPDLVWGFKTTKRDIGRSQLKRIEVLAKLLVQANPDLEDALARRKVAGGEFVTFTLDGAAVPWDDLAGQVAEMAGDVQGAEKVLDRLRSLDVVLAVGIVDDWVIVTIGDSVDHLEKLAFEDPDKGLLATRPFAPLRADADKPITAVSYVSEALAEAFATTPDDLDDAVESLSGLAGDADLPPAAEKDVRGWLTRIRDEFGKRIPDPGAWMSYSFFSEQGYEGYAWDWTRNLPFDGVKRLDLLRHTGGTPVAVAMQRFRSDPRLIDAMVGIVEGAWNLFATHGRPRLDAEAQDRVDAFEEHVAPLGAKFADVIRGKIVPALADGQVGLVLDAKTRTKRPHREMPASAELLPLVEPAIVLPLADRKQFVSGLNDLFALADEAVAAARRMDPDAVPAGYEVPEPTKTKVDGGTVWSFALAASGLDDQLQPAIGVGDEAVVFSLGPQQAGRMITAVPLETGRRLTRFDEPLVSAAAVDVAGFFDALAPWVRYVARYASVQDRDGAVDPDSELSADDENEQTQEALEHVRVVFEVLKTLKLAVAETAFRDEALVTHWQNVIRDLPQP